MMSGSDWVNFISVTIAVVTVVESSLTRFVRSKSRSYAAAKDFQRLREDFDKMRSTLEIMESDFRRVDRDLVALRTLIQVRLNPGQNLDSSG